MHLLRLLCTLIYRIIIINNNISMRSREIICMCAYDYTEILGLIVFLSFVLSADFE